MILQKRSAELERNISMNNSLNYVSGFELGKITSKFATMARARSTRGVLLD